MFVRDLVAGALALGAQLGVAHSQGQVWIVDSEGLGDFSEIQPAVDAAQDGDAILIVPRWGSPNDPYGGFLVLDKALYIGAVRGAKVRVGPVRIEGLGSDKVLALSRLLLSSPYPATSPTLLIGDCQGGVFAFECRADGGWGQPAAVVQQALDLTLVDCELFGGEHDGTPGSGLVAIGSIVAVYGGRIRGGDAVDDEFWIGGQGGHGVTLRAGSDTFLQKVQIQGGEGGWTCFEAPGPGGHGVLLQDASRAHAVETTPTGGYGGCQTPFCGNVCASDGQSHVQSGGSTWEDLGVPVRRLLSGETQAHPGTLALGVRGQAGDEVLLGVSSSSVLIPNPGRGGYVHLADGLRGQLLGTVPQAGEMLIELPLAPLPAGERARRTLYQLNVIDTDGRRLLGSPALIETLDPTLVSPCERPIHVRAGAPPGGDGSSWADAFDDLPAALAVAAARAPACREAYTEVWIAAGTYTPGPPGAARTVHFPVPHGVALIGGFAGHESSADERDPQANPAILSGDLAGDDLPDFGNRADNAFRVVQLTGSVSISPHIPRLEGLTVRGGQADGGTGQTSGAGVRFDTAILRGCRIVDNFALTSSGGISGGTTSPSWIVGCEIRGNRAHTRGGGGVLNQRVFVLNCEVADNELLGPDGAGGGLSFSASQILGQGSLDGSVFSGNRAARGAALTFVAAGPHATLPPYTVTNLTLVDNHADQDGGGLLLESGHLRVANSILWGNTAGGLADQRGQFVADAMGTQVSLEHCCVQGLAAPFGPGNLALDPLLDANLELLPGSPCIDSGANARVAPDRADLDADLDTLEPQPLERLGRPRFVDDPAAPDRGAGTSPLVDLGAHERQVP